MQKEQTWDLSAHLTEAELVSLAEAFGGTRLYIPRHVADDHEIVRAIGRNGFTKLSDAYGRDTIRIPVCRELRALHYRAQGLSNGRIATKLCMTETGINLIFQRVSERDGSIVAKPNVPSPASIKKLQEEKLLALLSVTENIRLASEFGGRDISLVEAAEEHEQLFQTIGPAALEKLRTAFNDRPLHVPNFYALRGIAARNDGFPDREIVQRLGITKAKFRYELTRWRNLGNAVPRAKVKRAPVPTSETSPASTGENDARAPLHIGLLVNGVNITLGSKAA